eukprot:scaffold3726_cov270-Pinguiococcus_pyrenoidosus.AAC.5
MLVTLSPLDPLHFRVVAPESVQLLGGVSVVDEHRGAGRDGEVLAAIAELHHAALLDPEVLHDADVVREKGHQPHLLEEGDQHVEAVGMQAQGRGAFVEGLAVFDAPFLVVPHPDATIHSAGGDQWLPHAGVDARDSRGGLVDQRRTVFGWHAGSVQRAKQMLELHALLLLREQVRGAEAEAVDLLVLRANAEQVFAGAQRHPHDCTVIAHDGELVRALERLPRVVGRLEQVNVSPVSSAQKSFAVLQNARDGAVLERRRGQHAAELHGMRIHEQELALVCPKHEPVLRQPALHHVALRLALDVDIDRTQLAFHDAVEVEQRIATDAHEVGVVGADLGVVHLGAGRSAHSRGANDFGRLLDVPERHRVAGRTSLREAEATIRCVVCGHDRLIVQIEHFAPLERLRVEQAHSAGISNAHGLLVGADVQRDNRRRIALHQILLLRLQVVHDAHDATHEGQALFVQELQAAGDMWGKPEALRATERGATHPGAWLRRRSGEMAGKVGSKNGPATILVLTRIGAV